jgi:hypothetical protein
MHFQTFDMAGFLSSLIIILSISSWQVRPKDRQSLTCLDYIVTLYEIDKEASGYGSCFCLSFRQPRQFMCFKFSMLDDIDF